MMKKLISVIVPVYNGEKTIERTLQSLIDQSFRQLKVIVVNDGSKDNTEAVVRMFMAKYPDRIDYYYKENSGIADTRNFGVSKVDTEFFGFLDSDDYVDSMMYQEMYEKMTIENSDICTCNFYWNYPEISKNKLAVDGPYGSKKEMIEKMFMTLWNKLYRTSFIRGLDIEFPTGLRYEDACYLYCLIPYIDKISFVDKPFVYYVQLEGSITHTYNINIDDMIKVFTKIRNYYQEHDFEDEYYSELEYVFIRFFLGNSYLRTCRIDDVTIRNDILDRAWEFLQTNFPDWRNNSYLLNSGMKNRYFRLLNYRLYKANVHIFRILYMLRIFR